MLSPIVAKLNRYQSLSENSVVALEAMFNNRTIMARKSEIAFDNSGRPVIWVLLSGWACNYMIMPNGDRQIISLMSPGDYTDTRSIQFSTRNIGTMAMTEVTIARVATSRFKAVLDLHRDIVVAFAKSQLADESIMQTWIANMARKDARQRLAHLLCEMVSRVSRSESELRLVIKLPFIQVDLADILGMSPVHINRVLKSLHDANMIKFHSKWLAVTDYEALKALAEFDDDYLHYNESGRLAA